MSLAELANLGEAIGGLAVLITLIYLIVQLRHTTDLAQGVAQRDLMNSFQANLDRVALAPEIWQRGLAEFEGMSNAEKLQFQLLVAHFVDQLEQALRMRARGLETQDNVDIYGDICMAMVREPGGRQIFDHCKPLFFPESRSYIERRLADPSDQSLPLSEVLPWHLPDTPAA
jgi:hypothetical protein